MALTAIEVFESTVYKAGQDLLKENVEVFNSNSNGAIVMSSTSIQGDFAQRLDLHLGKDLIKSRNPYANTNVASKGFNRVKSNVVKLGLGLNPIEWTNAEFTWVKQNPSLAGVKIARAMAQQSLKAMAEFAIGSVATCLNSNTAVKTSIASGSKITHSDLIQAISPMGDQFDDIKLYVMHSKQYFELMDSTFKNSERLFNFGNVTVMRSALGQHFLITDNSGLKSGNDYYTLGLKSGSVAVGNEDDFTQATNTITGRENIGYIYQAEWTSSLQVTNYRYKTSDTMNGLSLAQVTNTANWERISEDVKDETGVILVSSGS